MSHLSGSAENILALINQAEIQILDGEESCGKEATLRMLIDKLNEPEYKKKSNFYLKLGSLQKSILYHSHKLVVENKGQLGLRFNEPYLNRLCQFVYQKPFEQQFGKFNGILYDLKRGIEKIPQKIDSIDNNAFLEDLRELGITGTVNKLSSSRFEPKQCMEFTKHSLSFMGVLGSKWVGRMEGSTWIEDREDFKSFLRKIQTKAGKVRFLMVKPHGYGYNYVKSIRNETLQDTSSVIFRELVDEFECFEARFFDFIPCFRLMIMDNKILGMSRYNFAKHIYEKSKNGWEAPHLVIEPEKGNWSLFEPFIFHYNTIWKLSEDIKDVIKVGTIK